MSDHYIAPLEVKFAQDAADGTFTGYGSVFGKKDLGGDVISPGAFTASLAEWNGKSKLPKMLLQHGGFFGSASDMVPIGRWTSMKEDTRGLAVEGKLFTDSDRGKMIYTAMREGELDGLSIGYRAKKFTLGTKPEEPERTIETLDLKEVSVVLFGMNEDARIDSVKSVPITMQEFKAALRERLGYSDSQALAIAERGFKQFVLSPQQDEQDHIAMRAAVDDLAAGLKCFSLPTF